MRPSVAGSDVIDVALNGAALGRVYVNAAVQHYHVNVHFGP